MLLRFIFSFQDLGDGLASRTIVCILSVPGTIQVLNKEATHSLGLILITIGKREHRRLIANKGMRLFKKPTTVFIGRVMGLLSMMAVV